MLKHFLYAAMPSNKILCHDLLYIIKQQFVLLCNVDYNFDFNKTIIVSKEIQFRYKILIFKIKISQL